MSIPIASPAWWDRLGDLLTEAEQYIDARDPSVDVSVAFNLAKWAAFDTARSLRGPAQTERLFLEDGAG